ncbi:hypothetical protein [Bradyrhizobium sp. LVM 105]|uniref:hypothetical protein n=1 Tax=Bradyrhizobium sp. LVM 105 TaxID=2341115 RepID=UPI000F806F32|nr:hypothetical protein [Bradyrhizobium sp. LVM 105]RTE92447.1 hypothetical protein D6B98_13030 [Bradyrhizobium sp. LVM 105]
MAPLKLLKSNDNSNLLRPEDVSPKLSELRQKAEAIGCDIEALRRRQRELADAAGDATWDAKGDGGSNAATEARVAKILGRQPVEVAPKRDLDRDIQAIGRDIKDREAALLVLDREIDVERRAASAIVMKRLEPAYREIVAQICKSLLELHEANRRYNEFADHVNGNNVDWSGISGMAPWFLGHPNNPDSNLARYLREAVEGSFMKAADFPPEFR